MRVLLGGKLRLHDVLCEGLLLVSLETAFGAEVGVLAVLKLHLTLGMI